MSLGSQTLMFGMVLMRCVHVQASRDLYGTTG